MDTIFPQMHYNAFAALAFSRHVSWAVPHSDSGKALAGMTALGAHVILPRIESLRNRLISPRLQRKTFRSAHDVVMVLDLRSNAAIFDEMASVVGCALLSRCTNEPMEGMVTLGVRIRLR